MYEWAFGYQPDEWVETDWFDENGNIMIFPSLADSAKNR